MLDRGISPDYVLNNEPAICFAAKLNICDAVALLLKYGAKANTLNA